MNATYSTFLLGFALGLVALIPLALALRGRHKAAGYARGHAAGRSEHYTRIQALHDDIARHKNIREIERQVHQQAVEAIMQDCDERIAIYARRANPFTEEDHATLVAIANKLELAANTFAGLNAGDHTRFSRQLQQRAQDMAEQLQAALQHQNPTAASTFAAPQGAAA